MGRLSSQEGFTYSAVLAAILVIGITAQAAVQSSRKSVERYTDWRVETAANEVLRAIELYWIAGGDEPSLPRSFDDLLNDTRVSNIRHLRQLPKPIFEDSEWQELRDPNGFLIGLKLRSDRKPAKTAINTASGDTQNIESYSDWSFVVFLENSEQALN